MPSLPAVITANAGEPACQIPAIQEFMDHLGDDGAQASVSGLVLVGIGSFELVIVPVGALPQRRLPWVAGMISLHSLKWDQPVRPPAAVPVQSRQSRKNWIYEQYWTYEQQ